MNKDKIVAEHQDRKTRSMCGKTKPKLDPWRRANLGASTPDPICVARIRTKMYGEYEEPE